MGTITFNDNQISGVLLYYNSSANTYTLRGSKGNQKLQDLFPDSVNTNDALIFSSGGSAGPVSGNALGKYKGLTLNIQTGLAASSITGVWEYAIRSGTQATNLSWASLTGVVDGTNMFQNTGINSVTWDIPEDWCNYVWPSNLTSYPYGWMVRFRITGVTSLTEGGKLDNDYVYINSYAIQLAGFTEEAPCTFQQIYDADVSGSWGVVTKNDNQYTFTCNVRCVDWSSYFVTKNEQILFKVNWLFSVYGRLTSGEIYSGDKCQNGSNFIFEAYNISYTEVFIGSSYTKLYNSQFKVLPMTWASGYYDFIGIWTGNIGQQVGQEVLDCYFEKFRHISPQYKLNSLIGLKFNGFHCEYTGAIIARNTFYGGGYGIRWYPPSGTYVHQNDFSKVLVSPINPWYCTAAEDFYGDMVDCTFGSLSDTAKVRWSHSATIVDQLARMYETYSLDIKVIDSLGNALEDVKLIIRDKNGQLTDTLYSNYDGVFGIDNGSITTADYNILYDIGKSWSVDQHRFREVLITSGVGINQRRFIISGGTSTTSPLTPTLDILPSVNDRYVILPYLRVKKFTPISFTPNTTQYSDTTLYNPFTFIISKVGYETVTMSVDVSTPFKNVIVITKSKIQIDQETL